MARLLVIEDQKKLLQSLHRGLEEEGYEVVAAATGEQGYYAATTGAIDAVVLDLMLPGRDGLQVLRDLRANGFTKPVLILTARDTVDDRVHGLDGGADDYLVKPFAFAELLARLRALLRRDVSGRELFLRADDLEMDLLARRVVRAGVELDLTRREFELLEYLLRHKDAAVTREMIARDVWKDGDGALTNTIDVYITLLRKKVERTGLRQIIQTIRGVGYIARDAT
jgi:two-component system, OmpR family, copper resistance phosphate regulon response regulator CusR